MIGFHPRAARVRTKIEATARLDGVFWIDVSSSMDALNFKRFDPVANFGLHQWRSTRHQWHFIDSKGQPGAALNQLYQSTIRHS